jgi:hypothetical protein
MVRECVAFDEARRRDGQWIEGTALLGGETAKTVRWKSGQAVVVDGPFAETKEWLGGVVSMALGDTRHAVELLSTHPALRYGVVIEIRPVDEAMNARWEARKAGVKQR